MLWFSLRAKINKCAIRHWFWSESGTSSQHSSTKGTHFFQISLLEFERNTRNVSGLLSTCMQSETRIARPTTGQDYIWPKYLCLPVVEKMFSLVQLKFWVDSWSDSHKGFGVEGHRFDHHWISLYSIWFLLMCFQNSEWMQLYHEFSTEILIDELCG